MNLTEFLNLYDACPEGRKWALSIGCETIEQIWLRDDLKPEWRIWVASRVLPDKDLRLFSCWCVRQVWHLLTDERSRNAVEVAERYAVGDATEEELVAARDAAWAAARDAARDAAQAAAQAAARAAAADAAWAAAQAAAQAAQNNYLRTNFPEIHVGTGTAK